MAPTTDALKGDLDQLDQQRKSNIKGLNNIDVVFTKDKSKWTRCIVLETCDSAAATIGNAGKLDLRQSPSVDQNGNTDNSGTIGMGWFPGYAINVETGVRLNMAFGENSSRASTNGKDMKWNPVNIDINPNTDTLYPGDAYFGGMHGIYIFQSNDNVAPHYDQGNYYYNLMATNNLASKTKVIKDITWLFPYPMANPVLGYIPSDVFIKLRVAKPYAKDAGKLPEYSFNTADITTVNDDNTTAKESLDKINIVPNPYYGFSSYESRQLDRIVKIVNLPDKCKVRIYTLNGTLVKTFQKDDRTTSDLVWNLDNDAGVPIASGMYIVHVEVDGVGEKILKWFGVMRETDLSTF